MTSPPNDLTSPSSSETPVGLQFRIWLGCLGGVLVSGAGMLAIFGWQGRPGGVFDAPTLLAWLAADVALGVLVGGGLALWLTHRLLTHLQGLIAGVATGQVSELRGLPASSGWGELSQLTQQIQQLITHHRQAVRATEELEEARGRLSLLRAGLERWFESERWAPMRGEAGSLGPLIEFLDRGFARSDEVREQNQEAARKVATELGRALDEARESAEQAEKGFVEATALLTTVRELQRLGGELDRALGDWAAEGVTPAEPEAPRQAVRAAIDELIATSVDCVDDLAAGLSRVREIAGQVQVLGNRATLIALEAAVGRRSEAEAGTGDEMRRLAADVRNATDAVERLSRDVETRSATAAERMRSVRERVARRLEALPAIPEPPRSRPELDRLLARVREMIQDAAQKGERLSTAGERVSRAAERLARGLEEETAEVGGLLVRLSPPEGLPAAGARPEAPRSGGATPTTPSDRLGGLRLLGAEDRIDPEAARAREERP